MGQRGVSVAIWLVQAAILGFLGEAAWGADPGGRDALVAQGRYVLGAAGGCACHTPPGSPGLNAGGQKFEGPFGVVYSPNITPDPDTGIGRWTESQIVNATRRGERPDGTRVFPIHAYTYFAHIADDDAFALAAYLKRRFSGLTGDTYGAVNEVAEVCILILIAMLAHNHWLGLT